MSGMPVVSIFSNGELIPGKFSPLCIDTNKVANKIPYARLVFIDGDSATQDFAISSSYWFQPGKEVEIKLRDDSQSQDSTVFKGVVTSQSIQAGAGGSTLSVEITDETIRLDAERRNMVYRQQNTEQVIKAILSEHDLQIGEITEDAAVASASEQLVQYQSSDWDFLLMRADVSELIVMISDGVLSAQKPDLSAEARHQFHYGISPCLAFEMQSDVAQQYGRIDAQNWDIQQQQLSEPASAEQMKLSQGSQLPLDQIAQQNQHQQQTLSSMTSEPEPQMQAWANSAMQRNRLSLFRGTITLLGDARLMAGDLIDIQGVGQLFSGKTLITGVCHQVDKNGWKTCIQFGLSPDWYAEQYPNISAVPAAGLVPAVSGLQVGIVEEFAPDPEREFHLKVRVPALFNAENPQGNEVWARLNVLNAGMDKGLFFVPRVGDEVILGFINDDPRDAIILGANYSEKNHPPSEFVDNPDNPQGIVTEGQLQLLFNDKTQTIQLSTCQQQEQEAQVQLTLTAAPAQDKASISLSDQFSNQLLFSENGMELADKQGNRIQMTSEGIEIHSAGKLMISAQGETQIHTSDNMQLKGSVIDLN